MKILQVATSLPEPCGVGNFARSLGVSLSSAGAGVTTVTTPAEAAGASADITLVHHEWGLFSSDDEFRSLCRASPQPVVVFGHSSGIERFGDVAAGFMTMCEGMVSKGTLPVLTFAHPAFVPAKLESRDSLRRQFALPRRRLVLGTSGFLRSDHEFPEVVEALLPEAVAHDWLITLVTSRWYRKCEDVETALFSLVRRHPDHLRVGLRFLSQLELNHRLQACDLLWCWSGTRSAPYGSGTASEQYASGSRMVVADTLQHEHVLALPNVVRAPALRGQFVNAILAEMSLGVRTRHDPRPVSWDSPVATILSFLSRILNHAFPEDLPDLQPLAKGPD